MNDFPKLLLVDDRPENLLALEGLLRRGDAEILKAESGRRALELLLEHDIALALIDVQMPELDGFQLAELMRDVERTREIPIIFVTAGLHDQARIFKGYESGAVDFLVKPLDARILASKVNVFLQLYRQKQLLSAANAQLVEADRHKNEFLAALSHELRNPLAPIKNSLYVLRNATPGSAQAKRAEDVIDRQTSQLARLVDDLLDITRISHNKIRLRLAQLDLNDVVHRALEDHRLLFEERGITVDQFLSAEPLMIDGDDARLAQVIGNLLSNAAKFTPQGGTVTLRTVKQAARRRAQLWVIDTGAGLEPAVLRRLFQPFMQAEMTLDRSEGGLGLGLALVKTLVELHGGEVCAHSEGLAKGTELVVELPLALATTAEATAVDATNVPRQRRVLIIEDNVDAADSLRDALEFGGHLVEVAYSGPEGLTHAREFHPEVVLCDIGLPGMDGYELARAFQSDESFSGVYLVALTGYALPDDLERAAKAGFKRHLAKPPSIEEIEAVLAGAL